MNINKNIIIISDLDGTLLDHENYQFEAAYPALERIKQHHIPLILNSSKTAPEIMRIRDALNNHFPFVVENGAAIYLSDEMGPYKIIKFGKNRGEILALLNTIRDKLAFSFTGFNDLDIKELMLSTHLTKKQATLAMQREFTEPLIWQDSEQQWTLFCSKLKSTGLTYAKGGRFISVSGKVDKGQALHWLRHYYQAQFEISPLVIALGDSENDKPMLESADYSILIKSPTHEFPEINADHLIRTTEFGPQGWNNSIIKLLDKLL